MNDISLLEPFGTDMQSTSIEAYNEIYSDGTLQRQEKKIVDSMMRGFDYSLQELSAMTGIGINAVSGRCNGLKKKGVLKCNEKRKCRITNRTVKPLTKNERPHCELPTRNW